MVTLVRLLVGFVFGAGFGLAWAIALLLHAGEWPNGKLGWEAVAGLVLVPAVIGGIASLVRGWLADRRPLVGHDVGAGRRREGGLSLWDFLPFD